MYWTITFRIRNCQQDYAKCLQLIEYLSDNKVNTVIGDADFLKNADYMCSDKRVPFEKIEKGNLQSCSLQMPQFMPGDKATYVFYVDCSNENDMVNIIYFCLVNDRLGGKGILCIKSDNQQKISANMKDLLSNLIFTERIKECYFWEKQAYSRVELNKPRLIKRFSPIYYIDEKENTVEYWRQSVQSFLLDLYRKGRIRIKNGEYEYTKNYFLPHICPSILKDEYPEDVRINLLDLDVRLMGIFSECFCTRENPNKGFARDRYEIWKSRELFERVKDMPLLAMYIFCVSDYFLKNRDTDSMEQIEQEIFDARDMADGLLQILENVYHSEHHRGYFCFRVHNDRDGRSKGYLEAQYRDYMAQRKDREGRKPGNYLEIKVADYSHCTIPGRFYEGVVKKTDSAENREAQAYRDIREQARQLTVSSFFNNEENSDFWNRYNAMPENIVHHYGLQVFESLVSCYEGYFRVRSQESYQLQPERDFWGSMGGENASVQQIGIPGTQYDVLMPFRAQKVMQNISLNVNINYTDYLLKKFCVCETIDFTASNCIGVFNEIKKSGQGLTYQEIKQGTILELQDRLMKSIKRQADEDVILHFSADKIALTMVEMFCKAIMLFIAQKPPESDCYIMITDCTQTHFVEITRMMALFYNKQGVNSLMKGTQIFMSGMKEGEEFLISGTNLGEAIGSTEKLAFARCIHPDCLKILKKMLKNHNMGTAPNDVVSIVPFDMIEYNSEKTTLFEQSLLKVLNQDVQSEKFGCRLENLHVRIGSKIHVRSFYEAELLFHNNYYTSRFAYWLFNELKSNADFDLRKPFVLIGYENYSEMLLNELCNMFRQAGVETDYLIYEQKAVGRFRGSGSFGQYKDHQVVIIVPINSTMTTHIKTSGFLEKTIREALKAEKDEAYADYHLGTVFNYGIVMISDSRGNQYWEKTGGKNTIKSRIDGEEMKFYVEVDAKWEHPLKCEACFPEKDYTGELPLVETNKESVVPMHAIGIKREPPKMVRKSYGISSQDTAKLKELSNFLVYNHVERNGNHFSYYFSTEKLWDFPDIRKNIQSWLTSRKKLFPAEQCKVYDIIVAPLHFSNTAFVEEVNGYLFSNAALVLHFDVNREFRMNIKTKFSSVQQLYDNLCMDDSKSVINFHYVDDTIISGHTFSRMKSLIGSLIDAREGCSVTINIFKSIVLLLNRMSKASIKNYIEDTNYFMAYFNLNISSMRVNSDACILCKKYDEWNKLAEQASLNETYGYWKGKSGKIEYKPIEKLRWEDEEKNDKRQARAKLYMIASHKAKGLMDVLCDFADKKTIELEIVERLFPRDMRRGMEELIAMLKVLGRPFMTFRKEEKEAVFELMLIMLDTLVQDTEPAGEGRLWDILRQLWGNMGNRTKIITILLNRLAELESNYFIRKRSMSRIMAYCMNNIADAEEGRAFADNYLNRIKQLVGQSNDFAKGLYLEYLLLYDEEYQDDYSGKTIVSLAGDDEYTVFKKKVYLENTKLADYGIEYLADCFVDGMECTGDNLRNALNDNYYFDNFIQYLAFHKMVRTDEQGKITDFCSEADVKKIEGMIRFQLLYQNIFKEGKVPGAYAGEGQKSVEDLKNKFADMLRYLQAAGGAIDGEIIVPYKNRKEQAEKYIALELCVSSELQYMENKERNILEFMRENSCFEGDTYAVCSRVGGQKWILLKFYDGMSVSNGNIPAIYMLFPFAGADEGKILHDLKNILIFRNKIWKILNLSSSTLLQNWTDSLFYKQQMLKSRSVGHTEIEHLVKKFQNLADLICDKSYQEKDVSAKNLYNEHFELLINSMIGYLNSRVLGDKGKDFMLKSDMSIGQFWDGDKKCFDAACVVWKLKIEFKGRRKLMERSLRKGTEQPDKIPDPDMLRTLILAIFHNAQKHGVNGEGGRKTITIFLEGDNLCISNRVNEEMKEQIEQEIASDAYRSGEGISQAVIFDACRSWYEDVKYDQLFALKADRRSSGKKDSGEEANSEKSSGKKWSYVVKLPILERVDGE